MIRITIYKDGYHELTGHQVKTPKRIVREFDDVSAAADWLIHDSYFDESYTRKMLWERLP